MSYLGKMIEAVNRLRIERSHVVVAEAGSEDGLVRIVVESPLSRTRSEVEVSIDALFSWILGGKLIQDAFPELTDPQRELLLTGYTGDDWRKIFPPEATVLRGVLTEISPEHFVVEASEAGLSPGDWPETIGVVETDESVTTFEQDDPIGVEDDFRGYVYRAFGLGRRLDVLND